MNFLTINLFEIMAAHFHHIKSKKLTRLDLTPLVDLFLLLIAFFMLVLLHNTPKALVVYIPISPNPIDEIYCLPLTPIDMYLTLFLEQNHTVYYYFGVDDNIVKKTNADAVAEINELILQKKQILNELFNFGTLKPFSSLFV